MLHEDVRELDIGVFYWVSASGLTVQWRMGSDIWRLWSRMVARARTLCAR